MNIKTLLNKKTWKGAEIGKALIASFANDVKNRGKEYEPLISQADFDRMLNSLDTEPQIGAYLVYQKIYSSCLESYNQGQALKQQFFHGYYRLFLELDKVMQADAASRAVQEYPLILSKSQYERITEQRRQEKRATEVSFYDVLFEYLTYCIKNIEQAPAAVRQAIEACTEEAATNKRILSHYCEDLDLGYYTLPDGTKSYPHSSREVWERAFTKAWAEKCGFSLEADKVEIEEAMTEYNRKRRLEVLEAVFKGEDAARKLFKDRTGKDFDEQEQGYSAKIFMEKLLEDRTVDVMGEGGICTWHIAEELPEDLNKYDVISEPDLLLRYSGGVEGEELTLEEQIAEFKKDYPKLFTALQAELKKLLKLKKVSPSKVYTWGELADLGIGEYSSYIQVSTFDIIEYYCKEKTEGNHATRQRVLYSGIAIATDGDKRIDKDTGDYREPVNPYTELDSIDTIDIERAEHIEGLLSGLIEPAARYMLAYNKLLDILAETYNVPDLEAAKEDLEQFYDKANAFNNLLYLTFSSISGSVEEKKRKRQLLQDYFRPIELDALRPMEQSIEEVKEQLGKLGLSRKAAESLDSFSNYLDVLVRERAYYEE